MKLLVVLCIFAFVALTSAKPQGNSRGCLYTLGQCSHECEEGTHAYHTACGPLTPEATCDNPNPEKGRNAMCDYSACYCDAPTVRDPVSKKCVTIDQCPKK